VARAGTQNQSLHESIPMIIQTTNINLLWGSLIVEELIRNGVNYFCVSPGSRSAPLAAAVAQNERARHVICFDERGASFHALGYGRGSGKPAVLICTSGTAAANYYPAVIEASADGVPMIVLTADRPPELHEAGANQAIDQHKLYGKYLRWEYDLPCPDEKIQPQFVLTTIDQAVFRSLRKPGGPVHINCMFREPLAPSREPVTDGYLQPISTWEGKSEPFTKYEISLLQPESSVVKKVDDIITQSKKGIILAGELASNSQAEAVSQLAQKINWPIFPDINSGLRFQLSKKNTISYYDQMLLVDILWKKFAPDTIIQFGSRIVSKRAVQFIEKVKPKNLVQVLDHPDRHDPTHDVSLRIEAGIGVFCQSLLAEIQPRARTPWLDSLIESSNVVDSALNGFIHPDQKVSEISAARIVSQLIPERSGLFLASSMPVRDMDMFASSNGAIIPVAANRGASGIDGTVASATGFAAGHNLPATLVLGDLAMIHDLNSLSLLRSIRQPLIIIILNNNGSGIFSFLPIARFDDIFEKFFGTPHQLTFEKAAEMFGIDYTNPQINKEFQNAYQDSLMNGKTTIIEIKTDRKENFDLHQKIEERIRIAFQS
jgi:2-succinyl-5-enolpyruvyl-6-hydroxy-3-cyclohexene-1-carboxylate synthase